MKKVTSVILATIAMATAGCANLGANNAADLVVDQEKMHSVNTWARQNNTQVLWVSTPMRKATLKDAANRNAGNLDSR